MLTRGIGRAQEPDIGLGATSRTISSSSLNHVNVVSFFTLANYTINTQIVFYRDLCLICVLLYVINMYLLLRKKGFVHLTNKHNSAFVIHMEGQVFCEMRA